MIAKPIYQMIGSLCGIDERPVNDASFTVKAGEKESDTEMTGHERGESTAEKILDSAEERLCRFGYNGVSFRDIAADVGIKSASVHYFFPTKPALVAAVARRYTERCLVELGDPELLRGRPAEAIGRLATLFRRTLAEKKRMCLFGMLAAEVGGLPPEVGAEARFFFGQVIDWLRLIVGRPSDREMSAEAIVAAFEGAMLLARSMDEPALLDRIEHMIAAGAERSALTLQ